MKARALGGLSAKMSAGQHTHTSVRPSNEVEAAMILCPECKCELDVEEEGLEEGEILSCTECGSDFEVASVEPLVLTKVSDEDEAHAEDEE
jgi:alpha-aminoadipate/glutamate carrier protein LysW